MILNISRYNFNEAWCVIFKHIFNVWTLFVLIFNKIVNKFVANKNTMNVTRLVYFENSFSNLREFHRLGVCEYGYRKIREEVSKTGLL